ILATLLPIDQIIGRFYPIFGFMLLVGTAALFFVLLWHGNQDPAHFMIESPAFREGMFKNPIIPCLFVCIACGLISGFHSTQSPIVARTMASEWEARANFYGMMIVEGIIAMIWAGAGMAIYNLKPELMGTNPNSVLQEIVKYFLGSGLGSVTIIAVIVLAITSGDTALRSLRLSLSESLHISQVKIKNRLIVVFPLFLCISALLWWSNTEPTTFNVLWHYFAWANQVLAVFTLLAGTVWLFSQRKNAWITLFPALFMAFVVSTYILWVSVDKDNTYGLDLSLNLSYTIAACIALYLGIWAFFRGKREQKRCQQQNETIENREKTVSDQSHIA
ncbi:MAG: carbon starvation protein A, partial [Thermoguttaceae bacterium]|nr:carbon starvation protein A [Thermoguttaceae bacterium]